MVRYRRQLWRFGECAEVYIFPVKETGRRGKGSRGKRRRPSRACQNVLNNKHRAARLGRELAENFGRGDLFITLTYKQQPSDYQRARKDIQNYFTRVNRRRKSAGLEPLKCIWTTEQGSRSGRWHHHLVISGGLPWEPMAKLWGLGLCDIAGLEPDEGGQLWGLAGYLCKLGGEQKQGDEDENGAVAAASKMQGGRLHRTRNIITPEPTENDFEITRRKAARIAGEVLQGDELGEVMPMLSGYYVTGSSTFYNDLDGNYYIRITLKKYQKNAKKRTPKKRGRR